MAQRYDACLRALRRVKRGDYVLSTDTNTKNECLRAARDWVAEIASRFNVDPSVVYELDPYLARLRYVRAGDIIMPEDHNYIVDALYKLRDVLERLEAEVWQSGYNEGYGKGYEEGRAVGYQEGYSSGWSEALEACGCIVGVGEARLVGASVYEVEIAGYVSATGSAEVVAVS